MAVSPAGPMQFKITLKRTKPPVWRRIQVPADFTFWELHVAIQDSMGWLDMHLHQFEIFNRRKRRDEIIGIPDDESLVGEATLPGWDVPISRLFSLSNPKALYTYDFGDGWEHAVVLEKTLPRDSGTNLPVCIGGRRRCPPEDCGGPWGYNEFLAAISDPGHEEHDATLEWVGGSFDPSEFDPQAVIFDDPKERLEYVFEDF